MAFVWFVSPVNRMDIFILNKTVPNKVSQEQISLFWILNNEKITKPDAGRYSAELDYYGFFPAVGDSFMIRDINHFSSLQVDSLASVLDAAYFVDTYGVYSQDLHPQSLAPRTLVYGGLSRNELDLAKALKRKKKLIIAEFNILSAPTPKNIQLEFLKEFNMKRLGWSGRYFDSLDSTLADGEVPEWALRLHREKTGKAWPYSRSGIILVSTKENIIVLESGSTLAHSVPFIETRPYYQETLNLPARINFTGWFDLVFSPSRKNKVISTFHLPVTESGEALLAENKLSPVFPAVLARDNMFYYFAGSFSEGRIGFPSSYLVGIHWFQSFFYNRRDVLDTRALFWEYYRPLISSILTKTKEK